MMRRFNLFKKPADPVLRFAVDSNQGDLGAMTRLDELRAAWSHLKTLSQGDALTCDTSFIGALLIDLARRGEIEQVRTSLRQYCRSTRESVTNRDWEERGYQLDFQCAQIILLSYFALKHKDREVWHLLVALADKMTPQYFIDSVFLCAAAHLDLAVMAQLCHHNFQGFPAVQLHRRAEQGLNNYGFNDLYSNKPIYRQSENALTILFHQAIAKRRELTPLLTLLNKQKFPFSLQALMYNNPNSDAGEKLSVLNELFSVERPHFIGVVARTLPCLFKLLLTNGTSKKDLADFLKDKALHGVGLVDRLLQDFLQTSAGKEVDYTTQKHMIACLDCLQAHGVMLPTDNDLFDRLAKINAVHLVMYFHQLGACIQASTLHACAEYENLYGSTLLPSGTFQYLFGLSTTNINARDDRNRTPLITLAQSNSPNVSPAYRYLIGKKADLNAIDQRGMTALMFAVIRNNVELTTHLLHAGADVNIQDYHGRTALHYAAATAYADSMAIFTQLITANADVTLCDQSGQDYYRYGHSVTLPILYKSGDPPCIDQSLMATRVTLHARNLTKLAAYAKAQHKSDEANYGQPLKCYTERTPLLSR